MIHKMYAYRISSRGSLQYKKLKEDSTPTLIGDILISKDELPIEKVLEVLQKYKNSGLLDRNR